MKLSVKIAAILGLALSVAVIISILIILPLSDMIALQIFGTQDPSKIHIVLLKVVILLLFVVIPLGSVIWYSMMRLIIEPLQQMNKVTRVIASGNYAMRVNIQRDDEIGELSKSLNMMFQRSAEAFQGMANAIRDIKKRERDLAANVTELEHAQDTAAAALKSLQEEKNKLQAAKAQDDAILAGIDNGVVAIDKEGRIILFNWAASVISGYSHEEAFQQVYDKILAFYPEKDPTSRLLFIQEVLRGKKQPPTYHTVLVRKDGQKVNVTPSASPILNTNREVVGVVVVFSDATQSRQLEKLKDEFVSIASHELRTPMTAIKGMLSMLLDGDYGEIDPDMREPLKDISQSTDHLIALVNDLLDVSRIEAGRTKFELSEFTVAPFINETMNLLVPMMKQKGIDLVIKETVADTVSADQGKAKQVLSNLIGNSFKFTDKGNITVTTKVQDDRVKISIQDTGIGISADDQKKLFAKFQQVSTQQNGRPAGTGLGLYLSRELCRKMGGDLWIESSAPHQGSTFSFTLPIAGTNLAEKVKKDLANFV